MPPASLAKSPDCQQESVSITVCSTGSVPRGPQLGGLSSSESVTMPSSPGSADCRHSTHSPISRPYRDSHRAAESQGLARRGGEGGKYNQWMLVLCSLYQPAPLLQYRPSLPCCLIGFGWVGALRAGRWLLDLVASEVGARGGGRGPVSDEQILLRR